MMKRNDYSAYVRFVVDTHVEESRAGQNRCILKRKYESLTSTESNKRLVVQGDVELRALMKTLDMFEYERTLTQRQFHTSFIGASLQSIYGADFNRYRTRILSENGLDEARTEILVCTPRRFGKTTSVSMFCAAMLYCVTDAWISVFSTGQRASAMLLNQTYKFLCQLPGGRARVIKKNQEELFVRDPNPDQPPRRLFSYPSSVNGLKGVGAKVVIIEEASRLDEEVFSEVVIPLLGVEGTAILAISTPLDEENFYTQMTRMKDPVTDGFLFKSLSIELMCPDCKAKGLIDVCPHRRSILPPWKADAARNEKVKALMANKQDMYQREHLGISVSTNITAFEPKGLDDFAKSCIKMHPFYTTTKRAFLAVDTCGGGTNCMALVGGVLTPGGVMVIVSCDTVQATSDTEMEQELLSHVEKMRSRVYMSQAEIVSIIEANYGGWVSSSRVAAILAQSPPMRHVTTDGKGFKRPGVWTTRDTKERSRIELSRRLREGRIGFADDLYTSRVGTKDELVDQLRRYKYDVKVPRDNHGMVKRVLTGKRNGGGAGANDDLAMAVNMLALFSMFYEDRPNEAGVTIQV
jgi:hypothetical protein